MHVRKQVNIYFLNNCLFIPFTKELALTRYFEPTATCHIFFGTWEIKRQTFNSSFKLWNTVFMWKENHLLWTVVKVNWKSLNS